MIFEHVSITVNDLDKALDFYGKVFGFELLRRTTVNAYMHLDDELLEFMTSDAPNPMVIPENLADLEQMMWSRMGLNHLGFRVDDMDVAIKHIEENGGKVGPVEVFKPTITSVKEVQSEKLKRAAKPIKGDSWKVVMFTDPEGNLMELLER